MLATRYGVLNSMFPEIILSLMWSSHQARSVMPPQTFTVLPDDCSLLQKCAGNFLIIDSFQASDRRQELKSGTRPWRLNSVWRATWTIIISATIFSSHFRGYSHRQLCSQPPVVFLVSISVCGGGEESARCAFAAATATCTRAAVEHEAGKEHGMVEATRHKDCEAAKQQQLSPAWVQRPPTQPVLLFCSSLLQSVSCGHITNSSPR